MIRNLQSSNYCDKEIEIGYLSQEIRYYVTKKIIINNLFFIFNLI